MSSAGMTALRNSGKRAGSALISSTACVERAISGRQLFCRGNQGSPSGPPLLCKGNQGSPSGPPPLCKGNRGSPSGPPPWGRRLGCVRNSSFGPAKPGLPTTLWFASSGGRSSADRYSGAAGSPPCGRCLEGARNNSYRLPDPSLPATPWFRPSEAASSAVGISEDGVHCSDDRDHVRHHVAQRHVLDRLQVHE